MTTKEIGSKFKFLAIIGSLALGCSSGMAALIETALPTNTYISLNGYDWAWGASCITKGATDCDTLDFSYQQSLGWSIAESSDMAIAPTALDFLFLGANVAFNDVDPISGAAFGFVNANYTNAASDGACATAYFTLGDGENNCDWGNGSGQNNNTSGWYNQNGELDFYAEVLFIRNASAVPIPAAAWLFGSALVGLVGFKRKK